MTTKELSLFLMRKKGLDTGDKVLAKAVANNLIHSLRMQALRGRIVTDGKRKGVCVWRLAASDQSTAGAQRQFIL